LLGAGGIVGIIIASIVICLVVSWWKRKKVAEVTRRLSTTVGRGS